jgi:hypothetical protein
MTKKYFCKTTDNLEADLSFNSSSLFSSLEYFKFPSASLFCAFFISTS